MSGRLPEVRPIAASFHAQATGAAFVLTAAAASMDAGVYVAHGHVLANAQTGNVVLAMVALAGGDAGTALHHLPSFLAFCAGIVLSRLWGARLKARDRNSRTSRLMLVAAILFVLSTAPPMADGIVTAVVGFVAAVQITALSHIGPWSFNTGMITGNLRGALSAASATWMDPADRGKRRQAAVLGALCLAFPPGALAGAAATLRWGDAALAGTALAVLLGAALVRHVPDPVP